MNAWKYIFISTVFICIKKHVSGSCDELGAWSGFTPRHSVIQTPSVSTGRSRYRKWTNETSERCSQTHREPACSSWQGGTFQKSCPCLMLKNNELPTHLVTPKLSFFFMRSWQSGRWIFVVSLTFLVCWKSFYVPDSVNLNYFICLFNQLLQHPKISYIDVLVMVFMMHQYFISNVLAEKAQQREGYYVHNIDPNGGRS